MRKDKLEINTYNCFIALKIYLRWWRRYGFDKDHAKRMLIEIKR
jgi:hypothetical protein